MHRLGIIVNPMSGRDVRRVTARASTHSHQNKQQQVTRLILGALNHGVERIFLANEPFRINERAIENLSERDKVEILTLPLTHTAAGTSRIVARALPAANLLPLSTGTNNVFPQLVEASVAGAAAGLICTQQLARQDHCYQCKQIHVKVNGGHANGGIEDMALVDAVMLRNESMGSLLPFAPENIQAVFLTRAEPASVGMSPIGGYVMPCGAKDRFGVQVSCGEPAVTRVRAPLSPGLYGEVPIKSFARIELGTAHSIHGPGILAFDGDRSINLGPEDSAEITINNNGPWIIEPAPVMLAAAVAGLFGINR
ncbi:MAG: hypothetical protein ACI9PN_001591 [Candidatus Azotimanducaceae bacterium]|jgi:hypothetical protein